MKIAVYLALMSGAKGGITSKLFTTETGVCKLKAPGTCIVDATDDYPEYSVNMLAYKPLGLIDSEKLTNLDKCKTLCSRLPRCRGIAVWNDVADFYKCQII
jgi:hypothetical protein